jgi:hypothetical protein
MQRRAGAGWAAALAVAASAAGLRHAAAANPFLSCNDTPMTVSAGGAAVLALAFSPPPRPGLVQRQLLAAGRRDGTLSLWHVSGLWGEARALENRTSTAHPAPINALAFSRDGALLATGDGAGTLKLWDPAAGTETRAVSAGAAITSLAFGAEDVLAAGTDNGVMRLWRVGAAGPLRTLEPLEEAAAGASLVAFTSDGTRLAWAGLNRTAVSVRESTTRALVASVKDAPPVRSLSFAGHANLFTGAADGTMAAWDLETGTRIYALDAHAGAVEALALPQDRWTVASAGADGTLALWSAAHGLLLRRFGQAGQPPVRTVAFTRDGHHVAWGTEDGAVRLWPVGVSRQIRGPAASMSTRASGLVTLQAVYVLDTGSGRFTRIATGAGSTWSTDGRHLVFDGERPQDGESGYAVWDGATVRWFGPSAGQPVPAALGAALLVANLFGEYGADGALTKSSGSRVVAHDLRTGVVRPLRLSAHPRSGEDWAEYGAPFAILPDERLVALTFRAGTGHPYHGENVREETALVRPDGGGLAHIGAGWPLRFLPSGELVVVQEDPWPVRLEAVALPPGRRRPLFQVPSRVFELSADGSRLAYPDLGNGVVARITVADLGSTPRALTEGDRPSMSADGAWIAFGRPRREHYASLQSWERALFLVRVADGVVTRHDLPPGTAFPLRGSPARWWALSPDGRKIALTLEESPAPP